MDEEIGAPRPKPSGAAPPRLVEESAPPALPVDAPKIEGLVGAEVTISTSASATRLPDAATKLPRPKLVPKSAPTPAPKSAPEPAAVAPVEATVEEPADSEIETAAPVTWTAAASSIPSISRKRTRTSSPAEEPSDWDEPRVEFLAPRPMVAPRAPRAQAKRTNRWDTLLPAAAEFLAATGAAIKGLPRMVWIVLAVLAAGALAATIALWPREHFTPIASIRKNAATLDGQLVHIQGVIGQSFPIAGGYAFFLQQSGDTIVVFTRQRTPVERRHIKLFGTVSTGFLDGVPRPAVFETQAPSGN